MKQCTVVVWTLRAPQLEDILGREGSVSQSCFTLFGERGVAGLEEAREHLPNTHMDTNSSQVS